MVSFSTYDPDATYTTCSSITASSTGWASEGRHDVNTAKVCHEADGLVVIGLAGGSLGAGQEFGWACGLRMPILYLRRAGEPLSRQIQGTPLDLEVAEFHTEKDVRAAAQRYVRARRGGIEAHARRRHARLMEMVPLISAIQERWVALDDRGKARVASEAHLHVRRIEQLASHPLAVTAASLDELLALTGALGIHLGPLLMAEPLPHLTGEEMAALKTAAGE